MFFRTAFVLPGASGSPLHDLGDLVLGTDATNSDKGNDYFREFTAASKNRVSSTTAVSPGLDCAPQVTITTFSF